MTQGNFYFLSDEYCEQFKLYGVMSNKEASRGNEAKRPCFYAIQDEADPQLYWMVPISSQIQKYEALLAEKLKRYAEYDGLEFGYVRGRKAAFLLQNICPVTSAFIVEEYIDCETGIPVSIPKDLKRKINKKARKIIRLSEKGIKISITDIQTMRTLLKS